MPTTVWPSRRINLGSSWFLTWEDLWGWLFKRRQKGFWFGTTMCGHISNAWIHALVSMFQGLEEKNDWSTVKNCVRDCMCVYQHIQTHLLFFPYGRSEKDLNSKGVRFWLAISIFKLLFFIYIEYFLVRVSYLCISCGLPFSVNAFVCGQDGVSSFPVISHDRLRLMNPLALLQG